MEALKNNHKKLALGLLPLSLFLLAGILGNNTDLGEAAHLVMKDNQDQLKKEAKEFWSQKKAQNCYFPINGKHLKAVNGKWAIIGQESPVHVYLVGNCQVSLRVGDEIHQYKMTRIPASDGTLFLQEKGSDSVLALKKKRHNEVPQRIERLAGNSSKNGRSPDSEKDLRSKQSGTQQLVLSSISGLPTSYKGQGKIEGSLELADNKILSLTLSGDDREEEILFLGDADLQAGNSFSAEASIDGNSDKVEIVSGILSPNGEAGSYIVRIATGKLRATVLTFKGQTNEQELSDADGQDAQAELAEQTQEQQWSSDSNDEEVEQGPIVHPVGFDFSTPSNNESASLI